MIKISCILLFLLPMSASAMVFNPSENLDVHLGGSVTFEYDAFTLNEGLTLNYFAPENSVIEIVSQGDIFIGGSIFSQLNGSVLSFKSDAGITISGDLSASHLFLTASEINLVSGSRLAVQGGQADLSTLNSGAKVTLTSGAAGVITVAQDVNLNEGKVLIDNKTIVAGTIELNPLGGEGSLVVQTPVPLPAPVLLFSSALLSLIAFKRQR